jgi:hypothetical protein
LIRSSDLIEGSFAGTIEKHNIEAFELRQDDIESVFVQAHGVVSDSLESHGEAYQDAQPPDSYPEGRQARIKDT